MSAIFLKPVFFVIAVLLSLIAWGLDSGQPGGVLNALQGFFGGPSFSPTKPPFVIISGVNDAATGIFTYLTQATSFKPNGTLVEYGTFKVPNIVLLVVFAGLTVFALWKLYDKALETPSILDDLICFGGFLILLAVWQRLLTFYGFPLLENGFVRNLIIILFLLTAVFAGEKGATEKLTPFLRVLGQAILFSFLLYPKDTAGFVFNIMAALKQFGAEVFHPSPQLGMYLVVMLVLGWQTLSSLDQLPIPPKPQKQRKAKPAPAEEVSAGDSAPVTT